MNEYPKKIKLQISEMDYGEALRKIIASVPNGKQTQGFMLQLVKYNQAIDQYQKGILPERDFASTKIQIFDGISYFIEKLSDADLANVYKQLNQANDNGGSTSASNIHNLLLVSSLPFDLEPLSVNREFKRIEQQLKLVPGEPKVKIVDMVLAASFSELVNGISSNRPTIVHFAGHGERDNIFFENGSGEREGVNIDTLYDLMREYKEVIRCFFLNACDSASAAMISGYDMYVICMNQPIEDEAAINFSTAFYSLLARGESFERSFRLACIQLRVSNWNQRDVPELWFKGNRMQPD